MVNNADETIGSNLAKLRGNVSQQELGEMMRGRGFKWSQATVWEIERGKRPLRLAEANEVLSLLKRRPEELTAFLSSEQEASIRTHIDAIERARDTLEMAMDDYDALMHGLAELADELIRHERMADVSTSRWAQVSHLLENERLLDWFQDPSRVKKYESGWWDIVNDPKDIMKQAETAHEIKANSPRV
ncbi:helix-turn-helix domain-containing protein [Glutamicibacter nicotianae]|uniref:helix-turn-helix domain-containing protein n=1 Tax=Glutamicibacter nicotianae TaxID=37929 RepID=UPI0025525654|nr:helix-turn-helix transcriptional regulator [Glutamicibacter nicotianae]WIV43045.1 helix-turn-helix transcriptional regulator [Glutamicibacter nicotianae]